MNDIATQFNAVKYAAELKTFAERPVLTPEQAAMVDKFHETRDPLVLSVLADHFEENGNEALGQLLRYGVEHGEVVSTPRDGSLGDYPANYHPHAVTGYIGASPTGVSRQRPTSRQPVLRGVVRLATPGSATHNHVIYVPVHRPEVRRLFEEMGETPENNGYPRRSYDTFYRGTDTEG